MAHVCGGDGGRQVPTHQAAQVGRLEEMPSPLTREPQSSIWNLIFITRIFQTCRDVEQNQQFSFVATRAVLESIRNRNAWNWNEA